ncbi:MAG TPA: hypothetical protein VHE34_13130 [Puia sp.]|uniref:hypothetical protein n=1 Tax=Puia sp. TaxID=2045100 RepID=UPI002BDEC27E|nr:hypothetical protein [Puia sp.]HVU96165.1 hypothetical protein [Puia sp.]
MQTEADFMDLIHWDVGFALKKMNEQIDEGLYKRLVISADRPLFQISGLKGYLERTSIANLARVRDIYKKACTVVALHNSDFKVLENDITHELSHSFVLPGGGFLQINCAMECIEIRNKDIFNTIPAKDNYDHFFEEHPNFSIYSSQEFANACSQVLNILSAFFPQIGSPSVNTMTNEEKFLCLLLLKTKNNPKYGFDPAILARLIGLPTADLPILIFQLSEGDYLNTRQGFGNSLVITSKGIQLARALLAHNRIKVVKFFSAKYLSPTNVAEQSVIFYYHVIVPDQSEANYSITMHATDVVAGTWNLSFAADRPGEQLLLLHAKDHIARKLLQGDLQQHEDVEIRARDLRSLPQYTAQDLIPVKDAEFLVELPQRTVEQLPRSLTVEQTAEELGGWILKTRTTINALFKAKYKEELFLHPDIKNILDLHKEVTHEEAFYTRVVSLATTVGDLNLPILRKLTNPPNNQVRSISLLSDFVQTLTTDATDIIRPMRNITTIRNAYPSHKDKKETIDAYREMGITPPVVYYSDSWKLILTAYWKALESLRDLFLQKLGEPSP